MATYVKNATRYQPADWFTSNYTVSTNAERQREASFQVRQESRFLSNETDSKTKWDNYDNNTRLADRVDEIRKWKEILEKSLADLDKEIADLNEAKELTEISLQEKEVPMDVVIENLTTREGRQAIDVVQDEVENQLHKEMDVINKIKAKLQQKCDESFEQLCLLQEARQQVLLDLQDKNIALGIDIDQYNLNENSPGISYKPNSTRVPKGSTTPQQWEDFSKYNKERADAEMRSSTRLREAIHHTLQECDNDLEAQKLASEYAFRKRIHETERAKKELEWQKANGQCDTIISPWNHICYYSNLGQLNDPTISAFSHLHLAKPEQELAIRNILETEKEIADMEEDIRNLEQKIRDKINPTKLAQTRLENRTYRPNVELCRDEAQYGLTDEVRQLAATKAALEEKLRQAQHALDGLQKQLHRINEDLAIKNNSLMLDNRCLAAREKLNVRPKTATEGNRVLTGIHRERSMYLA